MTEEPGGNWNPDPEDQEDRYDYEEIAERVRDWKYPEQDYEPN